MSGSDRDGVEVDLVFKDAESVEVEGKDEGGVTLPILNWGRPLATRREFRTASNVPGTSLFLTVAISTLITAFEYFFRMVKYGELGK